MAKVDLPYVQTFKDRHGRLRHYYRKPGCKRAALPGSPGASAFMEAYAEAHGQTTAPVGAERAKPRTINALVVEYYRTAKFRNTRESTQRTYRNVLERFRTKYGDKPIGLMSTRHVEAILDGMADTPSAANNLRKRLRQIFKHAVKLGWRTDNPVRETEALTIRGGGIPPWSDEEIARFEQMWPTGSRPRLALALLLYTGQRRSDVVRMGGQHVREGRISVRQLKTDARLRIPIHPDLQAELEKAPKGMTYLLTQYGLPFSGPGFSNWFVEQAEAAGLSGRSPHGLRKAAGRRLAEAGCSGKQIGAVLGHTTLAEVERYTRDADQVRLADDAMDKLAGGLTLAAKPLKPLG